MEVQAISRNIRISPRKVRIVVNLIRGKNVRSEEHTKGCFQGR